MNKAKATDAAHEISQMIATGMQGTGTQEVAERVYGAVIDQACDFIPDTELAAVIRHARHGMPMLIALDREQLYLLWVGEVDDGIDEPPTTREMVHVEPGAGSVKVETRYLGRTTRVHRTARCGYSHSLTEWILPYVDSSAANAVPTSVRSSRATRSEPRLESTRAGVRPAPGGSMSSRSEPQVQVRFPCAQCEGTKRIAAIPPPGVSFAPGSETTWCPACNATGVEKEDWIPVSEFRAQFLDCG